MTRILLFLASVTLLPLGAISNSPYFKIQTTVSKSTLSIVLTAHTPANISQNAPATLEVYPAPGSHFDKTKLSAADTKSKSDNEMIWEVPLTKEHSNQEILGRLSFYLCTKAWCRKFTQDFKESSQLDSAVH